MPLDLNNPNTLKQLFDGGHISEDTYRMGVPLQEDEGDKIAAEAKSKPNPEYENLKKYYESKGAGGLAGSADTRAQQDLGSLNDLATQDPGKLSNMESARLAELKKEASPQPDQVRTESAAPVREPSAAQPAVAQAGQVQPGVKLASDVGAPMAQINEGYMQNLKDAPQGMKQAFELQQQGIAQGAAAGMKQASAESAFLQKRTDEMAKMEQERQARESQRQQEMEEATSSYKSALDDVKKSAELNPNRYYQNMSTGEKVGTTIGLILGGFGSGLSGGKNQALELLLDQVNKDVDAQKDAYGRKKDVAEGQKNLYGLMREKFGDERQAEAATRAASIDLAQVKIQQMAAQYKSPQVQAQAMQAYGQLELEKQKQMVTFGQQVMNSGGMMAADDTMRRIMRLPDAEKTMALKELGEYQKHQKTVSQVQSAMRDIRASNTVMGSISPQDRERREAAEATIKTLTSEIFGGKSEQEFKIIEKLLPSKVDSDETYQKKMKMLTDKLESQLSTPVLSGFGIRPKEIKVGAPVK